MDLILRNAVLVGGDGGAVDIGIEDGRIAVICDHDDFSHFHEDQPPGNWIWWSVDQGASWDGPHKPDIKGFEPDRIMELPDGRLAVVLRGSGRFS